MRSSCRMKSNQRVLMSVSRRPLPGTAVGSTTSNALTRSVATMTTRDGAVPSAGSS